MPTTPAPAGITPAGARMMLHAIRLAWAAGDLDDEAVRELSAAAEVRKHAITGGRVA